MLILCYGLTKSGSTLSFELVKGMLESIGHAQERLPEGAVNAGHRINYVQPVDRKKLKDLLDAVGDRWIAVKTHAGFPDPMLPYVEDLQRRRRLQVIASYRDPRDICLSLIDAGTRSRAHGVKEFSEIRDIESAVPVVLEQIVKFRKWASVRDTLRLDYDEVAFAPDRAIDRIERRLGIACDREKAKQYAFEEAFTQKNKAQRYRALTELSDEQNGELMEAFAEFIWNVCEGCDEAWYERSRAQMLARITKPKPDTPGVAAAASTS